MIGRGIATAVLLGNAALGCLFDSEVRRHAPHFDVSWCALAQLFFNLFPQIEVRCLRVSWEPGDESINSIKVFPNYSLNLRGNMHYMTVILDLVIRLNANSPWPCDPANIVSAQVK